MSKCLIRNCPSKATCNQTWDSLQVITEEHVLERICGHCDCKVHLIVDVYSLVEHLKMNDVIAVSTDAEWTKEQFKLVLDYLEKRGNERIQRGRK
jgi:hypothetical protein